MRFLISIALALLLAGCSRPKDVYFVLLGDSSRPVYAEVEIGRRVGGSAPLMVFPGTAEASSGSRGTERKKRSLMDPAALPFGGMKGSWRLVELPKRRCICMFSVARLMAAVASSWTRSGLLAKSLSPTKENWNEKNAESGSRE